MPLRNENEIQRAHDVLVAIITKEVPHPFAAKDVETFAQWASVLCWVLNHNHQNAFMENLAKIEAVMKSMGYSIKDIRN